MFSELNAALGNDPALVFTTVLSLAGMITGIIISLGMTLMMQWGKVRALEEENAMKRDMLERGMSAEEIATVIGASRRRFRRTGSVVTIQSRGYGGHGAYGQGAEVGT